MRNLCPLSGSQITLWSITYAAMKKLSFVQLSSCNLREYRYFAVIITANAFISIRIAMIRLRLTE